MKLNIWSGLFSLAGFVLIIGAYQAWGRHQQLQSTLIKNAVETSAISVHSEPIKVGSASIVQEPAPYTIIGPNDLQGNARAVVTHDDPYTIIGSATIGPECGPNSPGWNGAGCAPWVGQPETLAIDCCPAMKAYLSPEAENHLVLRIVNAVSQAPAQSSMAGHDSLPVGHIKVEQMDTGLDCIDQYAHFAIAWESRADGLCHDADAQQLGGGVK